MCEASTSFTCNVSELSLQSCRYLLLQSATNQNLSKFARSWSGNWLIKKSTSTLENPQAEDDADGRANSSDSNSLADLPLSGPEGRDVDVCDKRLPGLVIDASMLKAGSENSSMLRAAAILMIPPLLGRLRRMRSALQNPSLLGRLLMFSALYELPSPPSIARPALPRLPVDNERRALDEMLLDDKRVIR
jgi:hypothetical protein